MQRQASLRRCWQGGFRDTPHIPRCQAREAEPLEKLGSVRIAPEVLATIASVTAQGVPGVVRLHAGLASEVGRIIGHAKPKTSNGVKIVVQNNEVSVELHIVVKPDVSMYQVGREVQDAVAEAIETMVGMPVHAVDVYIEDVA